MQRILAERQTIRIVTVEQPLARLHRSPLVLHSFGHIDAMRDAMAVSDDQRRTIIGFGFDE